MLSAKMMEIMPLDAFSELRTEPLCRRSNQLCAPDSNSRLVVRTSTARVAAMIASACCAKASFSSLLVASETTTWPAIDVGRTTGSPVMLLGLGM